MAPLPFCLSETMRPQLHRFGHSASPVVTVDDFVAAPEALVAMAAELAPFPPADRYYPGVRRVIGREDAAAYAAVESILGDAAPFIGGGFDMERFDLLEASFSMVTTLPGALVPAQRGAHFDSTDPGYLALMVYLTDTPGTAFYRQRSTGIERVDERNLPAFIAAGTRECAGLDGYIRGSGPEFEQTGLVEGLAGRLAIYQGCMLHSGIIPEDMEFSADPRRGRLTLNIFVQGYR